MKKLLYLGIAALALAACDKGGYYYEADPEFKDGGAGYAASDGGGMSAPGEGNGGQGGGQAGVITAAEWNDLDNWQFWGNLMGGQDYSNFNRYWGLNTANRFACKVVDADGHPVVGAKLELKSADGNLIWTSRTDNAGVANLWADALVKAVQDEQTPKAATDETYFVSIDGILQAESPKLSDWKNATIEENVYTVSSAPTIGNQVDIAFIVDATGSMGDEIDFLKKDLQSILENVGQKQTSRTIFTGTVFYRDEGDDYVTKVSEFTSNISSTMDFVKKQDAAGGGDWPEAVHTALEKSLSGLQWHNNAYSKLAFIILDAPAHVDHQGVVESMQKSISKYSETGIKLIPVFCSSYSKDCEFMCRQFAILTGGTYVFLTDDSGVGGEHVVASVGQYQVEKLNELIIRLIDKYIS
ncbi:MAG: hypothetical protein K6A64_07235 [Bacteroidales bacterium]|nr:hypothetical protein [Bacteroidales bacterium]